MKKRDQTLSKSDEQSNEKQNTSPPQQENIHDKFFKAAFSDKQLVINYSKKYLPSYIVELIDFDTLTLENTTYINKELEPYYADVVWKANYLPARVASGKNAPHLKITLIFEHKSMIPRFPYTQVGRYIVESWAIEEKNLKKGERFLPMVLPILFYHGKRHWKVRPIESYFGNIPKALLQHLPRFSLIINDISQQSKEEILDTHLKTLSISLLLFRYSHDAKKLLDEIATVRQLIRDAKMDGENWDTVDAALVYFTKNLELRGQNKQKIIEELKKQDNMGRAISAYDYIIAEGRKEGILTGLVTGRQEGRQEGIQEGRQEGLNEGLKKLEEKERIVIINMWKQKLSIELIANLTLTPIEKVFNVLYEYLDKEKVLYIENLFQQAKSYQEIAQSLQMPIENVQHIIEQFIVPLQQFNLEKQKQCNDKT